MISSKNQSQSAAAAPAPAAASNSPEKRLGYFTNDSTSSTSSKPTQGEKLLEAVRKNLDYQFAEYCIEESRKKSASPLDAQSSRVLALEYLDNALKAFPQSHHLHLKSGVVSLEAGLLDRAVTSLRNALKWGPEDVQNVIGLLSVASEMLDSSPNKAGGSPKRDSLANKGIQISLVQGKYGEAFKTAHAEINRVLQNEQDPDLHTIQLMKAAAMKIGEERTYVASLVALEARGLLSASDPEYLPIGSQWTDQRYSEFREELSDSDGWYQRSALWEKFKVQDVAPINTTAVAVGPGAAKRQR